MLYFGLLSKHKDFEAAVEVTDKYYISLGFSFILTKKLRKTFCFEVFRNLFNDEASGTRTPDNLIKSQVLYHLS